MSKNLKNSLEELKNINPFDVPTSYFDTFEDRIFDKIEALESVNEEFSTPEDYFDDISIKLLSKISENKEFSSPDNYFSKLEEEISAKTINETKVVSLADRKIKKLSYYLTSAAAVILIGLMINSNYNSESLYLDTLIDNNDIAFSQQDVYSLIYDDDLELESLVVNYNYSDDEIFEYLSESDINNLELISE